MEVIWGNSSVSFINRFLVYVCLYGSFHYQQTLSGQTETKNAPEICVSDLTQDIENGDLLVFYVESVEA